MPFVGLAATTTVADADLSQHQPLWLDRLGFFHFIS
jgi:hypothetical protein